MKAPSRSITACTSWRTSSTTLAQGRATSVLTVAAASVKHPQPRREAGQVQHPGHDVEVRVLTPPQALAGTQVPVVAVLARRIQCHDHTMPAMRA